MCGIVGGISLLGEYNFQLEVTKMCDAIAHRGPDGFGIYNDESRRICFGHRRLAVIDLSTLGHQPMKIGDYIICYNGEVYNYIELREELVSLGVQFVSSTDTEVILQAYIRWGEEAINKLNGMWSLAIYDLARNQVFCSRDRFGIKPFFYTVHQNRIYFASEIKAFLEISGWLSKLNHSRAYDFLANSFVSHTYETMLEGVLELRGGHNLIVNLTLGTFVLKRYYNLSQKESIRKNLSDSEYLANFKAIFQDAVSIALRSDVKVGSALSGGIDSSTIVSIVNAELRTNAAQHMQECVSAVYATKDKGVDESLFIDVLAKEKNVLVHKVNPSWDHLMSNLDKIIWHQDEPFPTLSIYAQYAVFEEAARQQLIVMLDGQGADEILAGYESFYEVYFKELLKSDLIAFCRAFYNYLLKHRTYPFQKLLKRFHFVKKDSEWLSDSFKGKSKPFKRRKNRSIRDMTEDYLLNFGLHSLLKYEDRNSMAFSIESRVPFLDYRIVEYALATPSGLKIRKGVRKYLLREAFKSLLPSRIYHRYDKLGFPTPQEKWTQENYKEVLLLLDEALVSLAPLFKVSNFNNAEKLILSGNSQFIFFVWRIIIFERWRKLFKVSNI